MKKFTSGTNVALGLAFGTLVGVGILGASLAQDSSVKVGILHSLTGTMAISEITVANATQLAIDEINETGGVLGKTISSVKEDGASDWPDLRPKSREIDSTRQSRDGLWRVDFSQPQEPFARV